MIKIDVIAGFLGAGKTTWINKMLREAYDAETVAIIENEFGEIDIDGELLSGYNSYVKKITSGCICCSLYSDFVNAIRRLIDEYIPSRILIEPTGLGRSARLPRNCSGRPG
jgi:G3E family GTPase